MFAGLPGRADVLPSQFQILFTVPDGQLDRVRVRLLSDGEVTLPVSAAGVRVAGEERGGVLVERELVQRAGVDGPAVSTRVSAPIAGNAPGVFRSWCGPRGDALAPARSVHCPRRTCSAPPMVTYCPDGCCSGRRGDMPCGATGRRCSIGGRPGCARRRRGHQVRARSRIGLVPVGRRRSTTSTLRRLVPRSRRRRRTSRC